MTDYSTIARPRGDLSGLADTPPQQMARDFREAATVIDVDGHAKGQFTDSHGAHCTAGALMAARRISDPFNLPNWDRELCLLADIVGDPDGRYGGAPLLMVAGWNDRPETTPKDVTDLLEAAAVQAEALPE